jgi:hypothetical protein
MPYTNDPIIPAETPDQLRARIPGWGADADRSLRPSVPRERFDLVTGAHWDFPERQPEKTPRERSIEHGILPPVFGTTAPLKGLSGVLRRYSYANFSEGRTAHWLLLLAADRVDVAESRVTALLAGRPDNPVTETGITVEAGSTATPSRFSSRRADGSHVWLDPLLVAAPWLLAGAAGAAILVTVGRRRA